MLTRMKGHPLVVSELQKFKTLQKIPKQFT